MGLLSSTREPWMRAYQDPMVDAASFSPPLGGPSGNLPDFLGRQNGDLIPPVTPLSGGGPGVTMASAPSSSGPIPRAPGFGRDPRRVASSATATGSAARGSVNSAPAGANRSLVHSESSPQRPPTQLECESDPRPCVWGRGNSQDRRRMASMPQSERDRQDRDYEGLQVMGDRWAQAGPVGGVPVTDEAEYFAARAWDQFAKNRARGMTLEQAAAWAAHSQKESYGDYRSRQKPGPGRGLHNWGSPDPKQDRRRTFEREMHVPIEQSTEDQQLRFREWELDNTHAKAGKAIEDAIKSGASAGAISDLITSLYENPKHPEAQARFRSAIAEEIARRARLAE